MAYQFSKKVTQALDYLYYCLKGGTPDGKKGLQLLEEATLEGDGDAAYFLARCYGGGSFIWAGFGFPEDDDLYDKYIAISLDRRSPVGVVCGMRTGSLKNSSVMQDDLYTAFKLLNEAAEAGEPFCQYALGNTYFYGDYLKMSRNNAVGKDFDKLLAEGMQLCDMWLTKSYQNGLYLAANNLFNLYLKGEGTIFKPRGEEAAYDVFRAGAQMGYPPQQAKWAERLMALGNYEEAFKYLQLAEASGEPTVYFQLGYYYDYQKDYCKSCEYYEKAILATNSTAARENVASLIYHKRPGVTPDYVKAAEYFEYGSKMGSKWGYSRYAHLLVNGSLPYTDPAKAKYLLDIYVQNGATDISNLVYGIIYGRGLGLQQDIPKAMAYLNLSKLEEAQEEKKRYRKTLFGKWVEK